MGLAYQSQMTTVSKEQTYHVESTARIIVKEMLDILSAS